MGKKAAEEKGPSAPEWIITFSDMITLLLTFFVMLQSMASVQVEQHKFEAAQASVQRALTSFGIAGSARPVQDMDFQYVKPQYAPEEGEDEPEDRSLDARTEMLRRLVMDVENIAKITPTPISGANRTYMPTGIHFAPGQTELDSDAISFLTQYSQQVAANLAGQDVTIYVLGIAAQEEQEEQQWILSAQRAQATADFIRTLTPPDSKWAIYSWGAGNGGDWIGEDGVATSQTEIMIAVLTEKKL